MFKRIIYDGWTDIIPVASFWLTFLCFVGIVLASILKNKKEVDRMGHLPLEDDDNGTTPNES
ncbi:MAG: hypothetical protein ACPGES_00400 [Coraliomargarita sp.]